MMRNLCLLAVSLALGMCARAPVRAQDAAEAQLLFERGSELYRARRLPEALEAMVASNRLVPNANVVFNVAQIYELLDRPSDAFNWYQRHLRFPLDAAARARAQERIDKLLPSVAVLDVQSEPPGAELYIDRVELGAIGTGPCAIAVAPGEHTVIAVLPGHREARAAAAPVLGERKTIALTLEHLLGRIELSSEPSGALVFIDGQSQPLGRTPLAVALPEGDARLRLRAPAHLEQFLEVHVDADQKLERHIALARDPAQHATLIVDADPSGALVRLDGRTLGRAPLRLDALRPGVRTLEVGGEDRQPWRSSLQLLAGSTTHAQASLVGRDEASWPYWLWVGYGAGAALFATGAGVGVTAFAENRSGGDPDEIEDLNHVADALMGAGLLCAATTLIWSLLADPPPRSHGEVRTGP